MNICDRLTMSRPCLHQRHSLKETNKFFKNDLKQLREVKPLGKASLHKLFHSFTIMTKFEVCKVLVLQAGKLR